MQQQRGRLWQLKPSDRLKAINWRSIPAQPKRADAIYGSPEHVAWAKAVINRAGNACEICGRRHVRLFADHINELKDGGQPFDVRNGQCLCGSCHTVKTLKARAKRYGLPSE